MGSIEKDAAYRDFGRCLMTRATVPEELANARARVASAVAAYDTVAIDAALSALGKAACAIGDVGLIPEELRPLLSEQEQATSLAARSHAGDSTATTRADVKGEPQKRDAHAQGNRTTISSIVTVGTLVLLVYGCVTYRSQPKAPTGVRDVNWGGPTVNDARTSANRPQFRPMPMVPTQQPQITQPQTSGLQGFMAILGLVMAKEQYEQQVRAADAERRERAYLQQKMLDDANPYSRRFSTLSPPGAPFDPPYGGRQGGPMPSVPPRRQSVMGKCTRCGSGYGIKSEQGQSTCSFPSPDGRICGGIVVWTPASGGF